MLNLMLFGEVQIVNHQGTCYSFLHHGSKALIFEGGKSMLVPERKVGKYKNI
jgi:hypothetical protein